LRLEEWERGGGFACRIHPDRRAQRAAFIHNGTKRCSSCLNTNPAKERHQRRYIESGKKSKAQRERRGRKRANRIDNSTFKWSDIGL